MVEQERKKTLLDFSQEIVAYSRDTSCKAIGREFESHTPPL